MPRYPDITVYPSGRIYLSARVVAMLSIHPGDTLNLIPADNELYLTVDYRADQYTGRRTDVVCRTSPRSTSCLVNSRRLRRILLIAARLPDHSPKTVRFYVSSPPPHLPSYLPIITHNPVIN